MEAKHLLTLCFLYFNFNLADSFGTHYLVSSGILDSEQNGYEIYNVDNQLLEEQMVQEHEEFLQNSEDLDPLIEEDEETDFEKFQKANETTTVEAPVGEEDITIVDDAIVRDAVLENENEEKTEEENDEPNADHETQFEEIQEEILEHEQKEKQKEKMKNHVMHDVRWNKNFDHQQSKNKGSTHRNNRPSMTGHNDAAITEDHHLSQKKFHQVHKHGHRNGKNGEIEEIRKAYPKYMQDFQVEQKNFEGKKISDIREKSITFLEVLGAMLLMVGIYVTAAKLGFIRNSRFSGKYNSLNDERIELGMEDDDTADMRVLRQRLADADDGLVY